MFSIRSILSTSLLLTLLSSVVYANTPEQTLEETNDVATFRQLLDQVDPPSLHEALHNYSPKKFQHGMFQEDRTAVEVIHKTQPNLATSIINLAKKQTSDIANDLKKRQVGAISNGTTTPASNPESSTTQVTPVPPIVGSPTTSSGESTSTPAPVPTTSTDSNGATVVGSITPTATGTSTTPAPVPTTSTDSNGATVVGSITPTATGTSTTPAPGHSISLTAGQVFTAINPAGLTVISTVGGGARTITPTGSAISLSTKVEAGQTRIQYQTSTGANGSKSVVTAVTVVGTGEADETPSGTAGVATTSIGASPGLQTGEAVTTRGWGKEMVLIVGGAVVAAGMM